MRWRMIAAADARCLDIPRRAAGDDGGRRPARILAFTDEAEAAAWLERPGD